VPRWGELMLEFMDERVGTRPESVVKRRGMLARWSWAACWGRRAPFPLRGGETKLAMGGSLRGDCWARKRSSSMAVAMAVGGEDRRGEDRTRTRRIGTVYSYVAAGMDKERRNKSAGAARWRTEQKRNQDDDAGRRGDGQLDKSVRPVWAWGLGQARRQGVGDEGWRRGLCQGHGLLR